MKFFDRETEKTTGSCAYDYSLLEVSRTTVAEFTLLADLRGLEHAPDVIPRKPMTRSD